MPPKKRRVAPMTKSVSASSPVKRLRTLANGSSRKRQRKEDPHTSDTTSPMNSNINSNNNNNNRNESEEDGETVTLEELGRKALCTSASLPQTRRATEEVLCAPQTFPPHTNGPIAMDDDKEEEDEEEEEENARSPAHLTSSGRPSSLLSPIHRPSLQAAGPSAFSASQQDSEWRARVTPHTRESISCEASRPADGAVISLSPRERPSTTLIKKAAATRPAASPATLWICLDDDDEDDVEIKVHSGPPSPSRPLVASASEAAMPQPQPQQPQPQQLASVVPSVSSQATQPLSAAMPRSTSVGSTRRGEPIAEVLPPTFRPRKGPLQAKKPVPRGVSPSPYGGFICDDDVSEADENEEAEKRGQRSGLENGASGPLEKQRVVEANASFATLPYVPSSRTSFYIRDDDNSSDARSHGGSRSEDPDATQVLHRPAKDEKVAPHTQSKVDQNETPEDASFSSPTRSVRDFLFASRRNPSGEWGAESSFAASRGGGEGGAPPGRRSAKDGDEACQRPVEKLEALFPSRFTRKGFLHTVEKVVSKLHCLQPGEFWQAFSSAEYVGEGSFGLVWRCRTVDGDTVAVKSCPISFHSRGCIDDAYSVLREIAIMRFLSEHEVPYVLPLHSAFFVQARESLSPDVVDALEWKSRLDRAEEERQQQKRILEYELQQRRRPRRGRGLPTAADKEREEEEEEEEGETMEEKVQRARFAGIKLPRFLSISAEDAMECDATAFLVTELCDGDLESIERHDSITKGVAFCVSSALAAMHRLGLVHLDLKPSNVLFAYENGLSQQLQRVPVQHSPQQHQQFMSPSSTTEEHVAYHTPLSLPSSSSDWTARARMASTVTTTSAGGYGNRNGGSMIAATPAPTPSSVKFYLSDFGNCRIVGPNALDEVEGVFGTFEYMDLRALRDKTCSRATDCFSLGATLYELLYSRRLYPRCVNPKCKSEEDHTRHCFVEAAERPVVLQPSVGVPGILQKVTAGLLTHDPRERWTADRCRSFFLIQGISSPSVTITRS